MLVNSFAALKIKQDYNIYNDVYQYEIWLINLGQDGIGVEQRGIRPCVIISNNGFNKYSDAVNVAPISSKLKKSPAHVTFSHPSLTNTSDIMLEQVRCVSKERLVRYIGGLSKETAKEVEKAIKIQFALLN